MAIGYFATAAAADTYFATRAGAGNWAGQTTGEKTTLLTTAYNRLRFSRRWSLPLTASGSTLERLQFAQAEMAWYMYVHIADEDRRKGLQAQGTVKAGVVSEDYLAEMLTELPFPPIVIDLLEDFSRRQGLYVADIGRNENASSKRKL